MSHPEHSPNPPTLESADVPQRVHNADYARRVYPAEYAALVPALDRCDPLADRCVAAYGDNVRALNRDVARVAQGLLAAGEEPLRDLVESVSALPQYFTPRVAEHGGDVLFRTGFWAGISLGVKCLVYGYAAPAGNKPLALSGRLSGASAQRRLGETARFVHGVCSPNAMLPGGDGWLMALRVRLMHARVRELVRSSGRWNATAWSAPINQHDMVATILLFSTVLLDALRKLEQSPSDREERDFVTLWRWIGEVLGVESALLPETPAAARRAQYLIKDTQGAPDHDSLRLTRALLEGPMDAARTASQKRSAKRFCAVSNAVCRFLLDPALANSLEVRSGRLDGVMPGLIRSAARLEGIARGRDYARRLELGRAHWERTIELGVGLHWRAFPVPRALAG